MSRQPYRSELGMISDVLQVTKECGRQGTIITTIARRVIYHTMLQQTSARSS